MRVLCGFLEELIRSTEMCVGPHAKFRRPRALREPCQARGHFPAVWMLCVWHVTLGGRTSSYTSDVWKGGSSVDGLSPHHSSQSSKSAQIWSESARLYQKGLKYQPRRVTFVLFILQVCIWITPSSGMLVERDTLHISDNTLAYSLTHTHT